MAMKRSEEGSEKQNQETEQKQETPKQEVSNADLLKIIQASNDKIAQLELKLKSSDAGTSTSNNDIKSLAEAIQGLQRKAEDIEYEEGIDESKIPMDDVLPKEAWVQFAVPKAGYVLSDDTRHGHIVKLPFGKKVIFFAHLTTNRAQVGKNTVTTPIATFISRSKAEVEWIRNHTLYNTLIFETTAAAANTDAERAMRLATVMGVLKSKDLPEIVNESRAYKLPFINNVDNMRMNLAIAMVDAEKRQEESMKEEREKDVWAQKQMLGRMQ